MARFQDTPLTLTQDALHALAVHRHSANDGHSKFEITGSSQTHFQAAIAMLMASVSRVTHMKVEQSSVIFSRSVSAEQKGFVKLPVDLDVIGVIQMAENWYRTLEDSKLPSQPDHDGSNSKGWKISKSGYWGDFEVAFHWCEHHK